MHRICASYIRIIYMHHIYACCLYANPGFTLWQQLLYPWYRKCRIYPWLAQFQSKVQFRDTVVQNRLSWPAFLYCFSPFCAVFRSILPKTLHLREVMTLVLALFAGRGGYSCISSTRPIHFNFWPFFSFNMLSSNSLSGIIILFWPYYFIHFIMTSGRFLRGLVIKWTHDKWIISEIND